MKQIESAKNQKVKDWKKLHTKKERTKMNTYLIEGEHLVEEALKSPGAVKEILVKDEADIPPNLDMGIQCYVLSEDAFSAVTETETPQRIAAVCHMLEEHLASPKRVLLIDAVQDPGNLGTMIRTADAAGLDAVVLGDGTADAFNGKTLRSAQGSHFHIPVVRRNLQSYVDELKAEGVKVYGTALQNGAPYQDISPSGSFALIVGNEGAGVDAGLLEKTDLNLYVPLYGQAESLNVAIAAAILMYHLRG
ncbi:TrmH family RNA methyltransferase [Bacillus halotolerans]|uniref:TrmH family RNA methyltransferase n=1 Tax=Bacillus halotolerans TaxID=260554 RepID=UPI002DBC2C1D|nr:RNA methyltransferase [Bacillus halotolerans]MEC0280701.1 RNA methyltransferase [Bacillus halotolerans]